MLVAIIFMRKNAKTEADAAGKISAMSGRLSITIHSLLGCIFDLRE